MNNNNDNVEHLWGKVNTPDAPPVLKNLSQDDFYLIALNQGIHAIFVGGPSPVSDGKEPGYKSWQELVPSGNNTMGLRLNDKLARVKAWLKSGNTGLIAEPSATLAWADVDIPEKHHDALRERYPKLFVTLRVVNERNGRFHAVLSVPSKPDRGRIPTIKTEWGAIEFYGAGATGKHILGPGSKVKYPDDDKGPGGVFARHVEGNEILPLADVLPGAETTRAAKPRAVTTPAGPARHTQAEVAAAYKDATGRELVDRGNALHGACPIADCGGKTRFHVFPTGHYFCAVCCPDGQDAAAVRRLNEALGFVRETPEPPDWMEDVPLPDEPTAPQKPKSAKPATQKGTDVAAWFVALRRAMRTTQKDPALVYQLSVPSDALLKALEMAGKEWEEVAASYRKNVVEPSRQPQSDRLSARIRTDNEEPQGIALGDSALADTQPPPSQTALEAFPLTGAGSRNEIGAALYYCNHHKERLVILTDGDLMTDVYLLDPATGMLSNARGLLRSAMRETAAMLAGSLVDVRDNKVIVKCMTWLSGMTDDRAFEKAVKAIPAAIEQAKLYRIGMPDIGQPGDNDREAHYIGTPNGVLDMFTGELVKPIEARSLFVTGKTWAEWNPSAVYPQEVWDDVDKVLPLTGIRGDCYGWAAGHPPRRSCIFEIAPPRSGKSTLAEALYQTLGSDYVKLIRSETMQEARFSAGGAAHNGDIMAFFPPTKFAIVEEAGKLKASIGLLKQVTGGKRMRARDVGEKSVTDRINAHLVLQGNLSAQGQFGLSLTDQDGEAVRDRVRTIPLEQIPADEVDPGLLDRFESKAFRGAFLRRLVDLVQRQKNAPEMPQTDAMLAYRTEVAKATEPVAIRDHLRPVAERVRVRGGWRRSRLTLMPCIEPSS